MDESKRRLLKIAGAGALYFPFSNLPILNVVANTHSEDHIFYQVFNEEALHSAFSRHLEATHLTYIYPEMVPLIEMALKEDYRDQRVYEKVQLAFETNDAILPDTNTQLHQAIYDQEHLANILRKSVGLVNNAEPEDVFHGHLDVGSGLVYIDRLWEELPLSGQSISMDAGRRLDPALDMLCYEQQTGIGQVVDIDCHNLDYVEPNSVSLITAFRGLHQREDVFVQSLLQRLKPGGHLILREASVNSKENYQLAILSQYVENLQSGVSWNDNVKQHRVYRSVDGWQQYLSSQGMFLRQQLPLHEDSPERSTLMHFQKTS